MTAPFLFDNRKPVIMQIVPALNSGGVEQGVIDTNAAVVAAGGISIVVSNGGLREGEIARAGGRLVHLPVHSKNPLTMLANIGRLRSIIKREKVDIVHVCSRAPAWSASQAVRGTKARYATSCHAFHKLNGSLKKFYNSSIAGGEKMFAVSDFLADYLVTYYGVDRRDITVIHRGIPMGAFDPDLVSPEKIQALRQSWGAPDGVPVILLPGRISRTKGQKLLLDALRKVSQPWFCVLMGSDKGNESHRADLESYIDEIGFRNHVCFTTGQDMPTAYAAASIVVSPSVTPEGFGRVPVEAQAMGKPIITTDHGGTRETVLRGETGWLVPPGNADTLADAISEALSLDAGALSALAQRARAHVLSRFTIEKMCADTLAFYKNLYESPRK